MQVRQVAMNDGNRIPQLGFGVWKLPEDQAPEIVGQALDAGYRHIDTAHAYNNEAGIGRAIRQADVPRSELFITSKLWNLFHGYDETMRAFEGTMDRLGLDYLDMYLIHWPVPMEGLYVDTWRAFIKLQRSGRVRSIGVSNFEEPHLRRLVDETGVVPCVNQIELHPRFQQRAARAFHEQLGIQIQSWSPLGQGNVMQDETLRGVAEKHGKSVAQIILRWHLDQDLVVIPRSKTPKNIKANFDVFDFSLDRDDMARIAEMNDPDGRIGPVPEELGPVPLPPRN